MIIQIESKKLKDKSNISIDDMVSSLNNDNVKPSKMVHPVGYLYSNGVKYMFRVVAEARFEKFKSGDRVKHIKHGFGTCRKFEQEGEESCYIPSGLVSVVFDLEVPKNKHYYVEEKNISLVK